MKAYQFLKIQAKVYSLYSKNNQGEFLYNVHKNLVKFLTTENVLNEVKFLENIVLDYFKNSYINVEIYDKYSNKTKYPYEKSNIAKLIGKTIKYLNNGDLDNLIENNTKLIAVIERYLEKNCGVYLYNNIMAK